jgi:hypothetical protein
MSGEKDMTILNEWGEYTDDFNKFLNNTLYPMLKDVVETSKYYLDANNAPAIDYKILEAVILSEISMPLMSAWMEQIEKRDLGDENE